MEILSRLSVSQLGLAARTSSLLAELGARDKLWQPICRVRWAGRTQAARWSSVGSAEGWRNAYRAAQHEIRPSYPVFFLDCPLELGRGMDMHFFEPRYRFLIKIVHDEEDERFRNKFVFASQCPIDFPSPCAVPITKTGITAFV